MSTQIIPRSIPGAAKLWRIVNRLAWRYDPTGAVMSHEARGILWRASDALHGLAYPRRTKSRR